MDSKEIRNSVSVSVNDDSTKYVHSSPSLPANKNKSYHDIGSRSEGKVDATTARPCAIIGPDRVLPHTPGDVYLKKTPVDAWPYPDNVYQRLPDYPQKISDYQPTRNISPRQTFQENMQRIMVPPLYSSVKNSDESSLKNTKLNMPQEAKYCDVPYNTSSAVDHKNVRNPDVSLPSVNPAVSRSVPYGWASGINIHPPRHYVAPEFYQCPEYSSYAAPRQMAIGRTHRSHHEDTAQAYSERLYQEANIRFKPYPIIPKEKHQQARYDYINNYPNTFHPPVAFPPHKYELQKPLHGHPYPVYPQVKYMERRIHEPFVDPSYQRPNQTNLNLPFHNQALPPPYGPVPGNCIQNKTYSDISKPMTVNKLHLESNNKMYLDIETARSKGYPMPENIYYNDMNHIRGVVLPPNHSMLNMHSMPQHQIYRRDNTQPKPYEYNVHYKNLDPSVNSNYSLSRLPLHFSPNAIAISPSDSNTSNDTTHTVSQNSQEDCGYVSQSSTASVRSLDTNNMSASNDFCRRREYTNFGIIRKPIQTSEHTSQSHKTKTSSSSKKNIDVRQFLQMWNEDEDETSEPNKEVSQIQLNPIQTKSNHTQEQLYVLGSVTVPTEDLSKYEHIQKVSKLPENIIGYNSNELLNQYEKLLETPNTHNFISKVTLPKNNNSVTRKFEKETIALPRPLTPLDVEAKISQSVIHKEVGCNFEIKPCSPVMLNVEVATPVQHVLEERMIEKFANPMIPKSPMNSIGKITNCNLINTQYPLNSYSNLMKPNIYGVQEFNTNSGISLASLPRLDNDIELNFPEINQQFINANKIESEKKSDKELLHFNLEQGKQNHEKNSIHQHNLLSSQVTPVSNVEKEISKLSKYRKNKKCDLTCDKPSDTVPIQHRVDSVIIKNPDNLKLAEDINEVSGSVTDIIEENQKHRLDNRLGSQKSPPSTNDENNEIYDFSFETAIDFSLNKSDRNDNFNDREVHNNKLNDIATDNHNLCSYYDNTDSNVSTEIQMKATDEHKLNDIENASVDIGLSEDLPHQVNNSIVISNASKLTLDELNRECNVPVIKELELEELKIEENLDIKKENDTSVIKINETLSYEVTNTVKIIKNTSEKNVTSLDSVVNTKISFTENVDTLDESSTVLLSHINKKISECDHNKGNDDTNFDKIDNGCDEDNDLVVKNLENCKTAKIRNVDYSSQIKNDTNNLPKLDIDVSNSSKQTCYTYAHDHIAAFISEEQNFSSKFFNTDKEYNAEKIKRRKIIDKDKLSGTLKDNHGDFSKSEPALFNGNGNDCKGSEKSYENIDKLTIILNDKQVDVPKLNLPDFIYNNDFEGNKNLNEQINNSFNTLKDKHADMLESETLPLFNNKNSKNIVELYDEIEKSSITDHLSIVKSEPPLVNNNTDNDCKFSKPNEQPGESFIALNDKHEKITEFQLQLVIQSDSAFDAGQDNPSISLSESKSPDLFNNNEYRTCENDKSSTTLNNEHSSSNSKLRTTDSDYKNNDSRYEETHKLSIKLNDDHEFISESKFSVTCDRTEHKDRREVEYCKGDEKTHEEVEESCTTLNDSCRHISQSEFMPFCENNECNDKITSNNYCKEDDEVDKLPLNDDQGLICETEFHPLCENNECSGSDNITSKNDSEEKASEEFAKLPKTVNYVQGHVPQFGPLSDNNSDTIMPDNNSKSYEYLHKNIDKLTIPLHDDPGHISESEFPILGDNNEFKVTAAIVADIECKDDQKTYEEINKISVTSNDDHGHNSKSEFLDLGDNKDYKEKPYGEIDKATLNDVQRQISKITLPNLFDNNEYKVSDKIRDNNDSKGDEKPYEEIENILISLNKDHDHISESEFPSICDDNEFKDSHIIMSDKDCKGDGKPSKEIDNTTFTLNDDHGHISKSKFPAIYDNNEYNYDNNEYSNEVSEKIILDNDCKGDEIPYEEIDKISITLNEEHENISVFPTLCDNNESKVSDKIILDNDYKDDEDSYKESNKISITLNEEHENISEFPTLCDNIESNVSDKIILDNDGKDEKPYENKISITLNEYNEDIPEFPILCDNNESKVNGKIILNNDDKDKEPYEDLDKISIKINEDISEFPILCDNHESKYKTMTENDCKGDQKTYEKPDKMSVILSNDHELISKSEFPALRDSKEKKNNEEPYREMDNTSTLNDFKNSLEPEIFCSNNIFEESEKFNVNSNLDSNISKSELQDFFPNNIYLSEPQDESMFDVRNSKSEICTEMIVESKCTDHLKFNQTEQFTTTIRSQVNVDSNILLDCHHIPKVSKDNIEINTQTHTAENGLLLNTMGETSSKLWSGYSCSKTSIEKSTHVCKELFSPWIQKLIIYNEGCSKISKIRDCSSSDEVTEKSSRIWSSEYNLKDNCKIDKFLDLRDTNELNINYCDSNAYKENNVQNDMCSDIDSNENSENKNNSIKTEKLISSIDSDSYTLSRRKALKRSLSESALQDFKDNEDFNILSARKRRKENQDIMQSHVIPEDVCSIIQSNRRNSISTFYNEDNLYIVIDNDLILTEENEESDKIYYTEVLEDNITQNCVEENMDSPITSEIHTDKEIELCEYANTEYTVSVEKSVEESWVEDVACIETVVSEDVTEDLEYDLDLLKEHINSNEIVTEESLMASDSEHIDKIKNIYGTTMSDDNTRLLETLYRTPQMNVNRALVDIESHNTDDDAEQSDVGVLTRDCCSEKLDIDIPSYNTCEMFNEKENIEQTSEFNNGQSPENLYQNLNTNNEFSLFQSDDSEEREDEYMALYAEWNNDNLTKKSNSCSSSPEVSSTTSEDKNSSILLKISNYNGSRISHVNNTHENSINRLSYKLTEKHDYHDSNFRSSRPLITKAAQKYIPPLKESIRDLKVKLPLPQHRLNTLKQLKISKAEPKIDDIIKFNDKASKQSLPTKIKPKFEDVLKSIDEMHFKKNKDKSKRAKSEIPKVIIKKNENGAHYASSKTVTDTEAYNPDLTGRKWQPWVFLEKNSFIDRMAIKNKIRAVYCHRKNTYVLADRFKRYKSIYNANFVISRPQYPSKGNLKYTIRLKHI